MDMDTENQIKFSVNEIFKSIDGEGIFAGKPAAFVRFNGCNLRCSYCDTKYALHKEEPNMLISEIESKVMEYNVSHVTLTGGEPLIQPGIGNLIKILLLRGLTVNIETNGSIDVDKFHREQLLCDVPSMIAMTCAFDNLVYTIDYKCTSSQCSEHNNMNNFNNELIPGAKKVFKFVVGNEMDLQEAHNVIVKNELCGIGECYLSPCYGDIEPRQIVEFILAHPDMNDVNIQLQLHKIIWDPNKRGV